MHKKSAAAAQIFATVQSVEQAGMIIDRLLPAGVFFKDASGTDVFAFSMQVLAGGAAIALTFVAAFHAEKVVSLGSKT